MQIDNDSQCVGYALRTFAIVKGASEQRVGYAPRTLIIPKGVSGQPEEVRDAYPTRLNESHKRIDNLMGNRSHCV